ncbi:hypothetical protein [Aquabacterium sp. OR-4]|uniref:hypothetical protein n=1 Tax=Aquabacterium sp. OR-4 TaxID=2978127 RepID=UPI0021B3DE31|nr:hypothetical protein [Aquabacterium sp. OR-4]MDT7837725.1 hypothetical protein [Aquabacterium sp. OR-4]
MKNIPGLPIALAAAAGAIAVAPSAAAPITLSQSFTLSSLLQPGGSAALSFDINSFLASQGQQASQVVGGQVSVFGFSEASYGAAGTYGDYNTSTSYGGSHLAWYSYYVSSYCSWWSWSCSGGYTAYASYNVNDYVRYADRDLLYTDNVADQMRVSVGQTSATDTASTVASSSTPFGGYLYDGYAGCYDASCSRTYMYHRERNVYSSISGALDVSLALDALALSDLSSDGILDLRVDAPVGQFALQSMRLDLQLAPLVVSTTPSGGTVPEPAMVGLTAVALAAAVAAGRRRRARQHV